MTDVLEQVQVVVAVGVEDALREVDARVRGEPLHGHNLAPTRARGTDHFAGEAAVLDLEAGAQDVTDAQVAGSGPDLVRSRR